MFQPWISLLRNSLLDERGTRPPSPTQDDRGTSLPTPTQDLNGTRPASLTQTDTRTCPSSGLRDESATSLPGRTRNNASICPTGQDSRCGRRPRTLLLGPPQDRGARRGPAISTPNPTPVRTGGCPHIPAVTKNTATSRRSQARHPTASGRPGVCLPSPAKNPDSSCGLGTGHSSPPRWLTPN